MENERMQYKFLVALMGDYLMLFSVVIDVYVPVHDSIAMHVIGFSTNTLDSIVAGCQKKKIKKESKFWAIAKSICNIIIIFTIFSK